MIKRINKIQRYKYKHKPTIIPWQYMEDFIKFQLSYLLKWRIK